MITYPGKNYEFSEEDGITVLSDEQFETLPKAVLLLLLARAARGNLKIADDALAHLSTKMGKYLTDGQLSEQGQRVFKTDRELLAALRAPTIVVNRQAAPPVNDNATDSAENPETHHESESVSEPAPSLVKDTAETPLGNTPIAESSENKADSIDNSATFPSVASDTAPDLELAALLNQIEHFLHRFVVFSEPAQAVAVSLWVAHTWTLDAFRITPYLHIYSPAKRCGKSRLLECLHALVCRPWSVVSATEATIMRQIDSQSPTLLYDEIDTVYRSSRDKSKEGLRAILNCGYVRGAKVPRCAGREIIEYSVYCPKAFAGIGDKLPDTVRDRSIRIQLVRRGKDQPVETFRFRDLEESTRPIVEGLTSWAGDEVVIQQLQASRPTVPLELGDRAADIAEPLLAIADVAGGKWAKAARTSLVALLRLNDEEEADEPGVRLLGAIRDIFRAECKKQLPTVQILRQLAAREEEEAWTMQWPRECASGNTRGPAAKMATHLRPYGISAGTIRLPDGTTPKGYRLEAFEDAFQRYLHPLPEKLATTPQDILVPAPARPTDTEESSNSHV